MDGQVPECGTRLLSEAPAAAGLADRPISYEALVGLVREGGGELTIELSTTEIGRERRWSFPYFGYGRAWVKSMEGGAHGILVKLRTTEAGRGRERRFPFRGYGLAWAKRVAGHIGGNEVP